METVENVAVDGVESEATPEVVEEVVQQEIELDSDKAEAEANKETPEQLAEKIKQQEEYIKKLKDEKSQTKEKEIKQTKEEQITAEKNQFLESTLSEAIESGTLTEDAFTKAEEFGMSKAELELALYKSKESVAMVYEQAGGKDAYFNMVDTVRENVSEADVAKFKKLLGNPETADIAILALKQKYTEVSGSTTVNNDKRIVTNTTTAGKSSSYKVMAEYQADMRKMRSLPTSQQAAYHAKISDKLNRSNLV